MRDESTTCWVISPGHAGMENQAIGLAQAMRLPFTVKRLCPRAPWTWLPAPLWPRPLAALPDRGAGLAAPWPDVVIASGRRAIPYALWLKRRRPDCFAIYIQRPQAPLSRFDAVIAPAHDGIAGPNVIVTVGALHRITPAVLAAESARIAPRLAGLPRPLAAVLVGGSNRSYRLNPSIAAALGRRLGALARDRGIGLAITPSRRTGEASIAALQAALRGSGAFLWDFQGDNPYPGLLGLADHILVTADSVSMTCEALATGKPVQTIELDGGNAKFRRFHADLRARGLTRAFRDRLETWDAPPLAETERAAAEVARMMAARAQTQVSCE